MGLRSRLFIALIVPLSLAVGMYGFVRIRQEASRLLVEEQEELAVIAGVARLAVENALRDRQIGDVQSLLAEMVQGQEPVDRIRIFDGGLTATLASNRLALGEEVPVERVRHVVETGEPIAFWEKDGGQLRLVHLVPLQGAAGIDGAMEIVRINPEVDALVRRAALDEVARLVIVAATFAAIVGLVLQRQVLQPLSRLARSIRALGEGRPAPALPIARPDELGLVAEAFNRMAEQLQAARQRILDETARARELEQEVRQAETLAVAGKLASGIAHEVGTPLNIISGRAEIVLKSLAPEDPNRSDLEVIVGQTDRISATIRSLLDLVRREKPEVQHVALGPLVERVMVLMEHLARRRGVAMDARVPPDLPAVTADPIQIQQVMLNLLTNALDATPPGGGITVEARPRTEDGRPGVALAVSDTGAGIPAEALGRIFDPFHTTKPPGHGTGLGLAICRDIARDHGGTLTVASRPGEGATFTLWLPVRKRAA